MKHIQTIVLFCIIIVCDIVTKVLFYDNALWSGQWFFSPHFNTGVARSLPIPVLLIGLVTFIAMAVIVYRYYTKQLTRWVAAILAGGIIGNAYDRLFLGGVRDFISIGTFPVFNIADIAISIGVGFLVLQLFYPGKYKVKN